jgi:hypothetical protein
LRLVGGDRFGPKLRAAKGMGGGPSRQGECSSGGEPAVWKGTKPGESKSWVNKIQRRYGCLDWGGGYEAPGTPARRICGGSNLVSYGSPRPVTTHRAWGRQSRRRCRSVVTSFHQLGREQARSSVGPFLAPDDGGDEAWTKVSWTSGFGLVGRGRSRRVGGAKRWELWDAAFPAAQTSFRHVPLGGTWTPGLGGSRRDFWT